MKIKTMILLMITFYFTLILIVSVSVYDLLDHAKKINSIHINNLQEVAHFQKSSTAKKDILSLKRSMDQDLIIIYMLMLFASFSFLFTYKTLKKKILNPITEMNDVISLFQSGSSDIKEFASNDDELGSMIKEFFVMKRKLDEDYAQIAKLASTDSLTNILNRRAFFEISEKILRLTLRNKTTLSVMIIDIDFFKKVNDCYGHLVGDEILKYLVNNVKNNIRESDIFARFGGEEFIILLPETSEEGALSLAQKIKEYIDSNHYIDNNLIVPVTISIGIAELKDEKLLRGIINRADEALYTAKDKGRNRVEIN